MAKKTDITHDGEAPVMEPLKDNPAEAPEEQGVTIIPAPDKEDAYIMQVNLDHTKQSIDIARSKGIDVDDVMERAKASIYRVTSQLSETLQKVDFTITMEEMEPYFKTALNALNNTDVIELTMQKIVQKFSELSEEELEEIQAGLNEPEEGTGEYEEYIEWRNAFVEEDYKEFLAKHDPETYREKYGEEPPAKATPKTRKRKAQEQLEAIVTGSVEEAFHNMTMLQGTATNTLTKIKSAGNAKIDPITGTATIKRGNMEVTITNYYKIAGLKTTTYQLLDALTWKLTANGERDNTVILPLKEYMELRGLKDEKEARKQVKADLSTLYEASISFKEKRGGKDVPYMDIRLCDAKGQVKNGDIVFIFGSAFFNILRGYAVMPVHPLLWKINSKLNPNSYQLFRKLLVHKNMNAGKPNEDVIAVKTLLEVCPNIPSYEEVMATDRALSRRIIDRFEHEMNALGDALTWEYCHSKKEPLTEEELTTFDYSTFIKCLILTHWTDYPDQTKRLETKKARIEQAGKSKSRKKKTAEPNEK